jgi:hypothetical protein
MNEFGLPVFWLDVLVVGIFLVGHVWDCKASTSHST